MEPTKDPQDPTEKGKARELGEERENSNRRGVKGWVNPYHYGLERWAYTFQRITGLCILLYVLGHIGDTSFFVGGPFGSGPNEFSWAGDIAATMNLLGNLVLILVVLVVVFHGINGIRLILSEFGLIFQKPSRPVYPYRAKSQRALERHLIWVAIIAAIVAALWTGTILI
jgi:succinate dehydrogenase / fumarate reductase cytochrome b subunit